MSGLRNKKMSANTFKSVRGNTHNKQFTQPSTMRLLKSVSDVKKSEALSKDNMENKRTRLSFKLLWRFLDEYKAQYKNASQWTIHGFLNFVEESLKPPHPSSDN